MPSLPSSTRTYVTAESFERDVIARSRELPVVVTFWAASCGPCHMLGRAIESEVAKRAGKLELAKIDIDAEQMLAARYGIQSIHTVAVFRDGEAVTLFVGAYPAATIGTFLDELLAKEAEAAAHDPQLPGRHDLRDAGHGRRLLAGERLRAPVTPKRAGMLAAMIRDFAERHGQALGAATRLAELAAGCDAWLGDAALANASLFGQQRSAFRRSRARWARGVGVRAGRCGGSVRSGLPIRKASSSPRSISSATA